MEKNTNIRTDHTLRQELELCVWAWNTPLKSVVKSMNNIILLRNVSPSCRGDYAMRLFKENMITKEECREFTKVV
jgi:hypothetical protein